MTRKGRGSAAATAVGALAVAVVLAIVLADKREQFTEALRAAPIWVLLAAAALQVVALVMRCEAWHTSVAAAGATISRRRLFRAGGLGNLGSLVNAQLGAAARIAALRRWAPEETPKIPALIAAEIPIITVEAVLAALSSFTLVGPLGLPWWTPAIAFAVMLGVVALLRRLAGREHGFCRGLAVLRCLDGRTRLIALVLVAVFAQIGRNWLVLWALGVNASVFDATAVLIAMVVLAQLPLGPSVGAAAVVVILGADGVALTAAAGVLLTVTGIVGALCFAAWAGLDLISRFRGGGRAPVVDVSPAVARPLPAPLGARG
jgi:uncharacterized membrane protein YbhN (UPF0104 family)